MRLLSRLRQPTALQRPRMDHIPAPQQSLNKHPRYGIVFGDPKHAAGLGVDAVHIRYPAEACDVRDIAKVMRLISHHHEPEVGIQRSQLPYYARSVKLQPVTRQINQNGARYICNDRRLRNNIGIERRCDELRFQANRRQFIRQMRR